MEWEVNKYGFKKKMIVAWIACEKGLVFPYSTKIEQELSAKQRIKRVFGVYFSFFFWPCALSVLVWLLFGKIHAFAIWLLENWEY